MKKFATIVDLLNSVTVWCWRLYSYCIYLQFGSLHSPGRFMCSFSRKAAWNVLCTQIDRLSLSLKKKKGIPVFVWHWTSVYCVGFVSSPHIIGENLQLPQAFDTLKHHKHIQADQNTLFKVFLSVCSYSLLCTRSKGPLFALVFYLQLCLLWAVFLITSIWSLL